MALYGFTHTVELVRDFTSDKNAARAALDAYPYENGSGTALSDSLWAALNDAGQKSGRPAVIVMTDGEDNSSSRSQTDVINLAKNLGIAVHTIGFGSANATVPQAVATQTGGTCYASASVGNLQAILVAIGNNFSSQYELACTTAFADGSTHSVEVTTTPPSGTNTSSKQFKCGSAVVTPCSPSSDTTCLHGNRFKLTVDWEDFTGGKGPGRVVPGAATSPGLFCFFQPDNREFMVEVLDGCAVNGRYWVMGAAATTVEYSLTVTDKRTGASRPHTNPLGTSAAAIADSNAFASCPRYRVSGTAGDAPRGAASCVLDVLQGRRARTSERKDRIGQGPNAAGALC